MIRLHLKLNKDGVFNGKLHRAHSHRAPRAAVETKEIGLQIQSNRRAFNSSSELPNDDEYVQALSEVHLPNTLSYSSWHSYHKMKIFEGLQEPEVLAGP